MPKVNIVIFISIFAWGNFKITHLKSIFEAAVNFDLKHSAFEINICLIANNACMHLQGI